MLFPRINEFKFTHPYFSHPLGSGGRKSKGFDQTKQETSESPEDGDSFADDYPDLAEQDGESTSYLGLSNTVICHTEGVPPVKPQRIRKGKPITSHTKKMLKACSALLEEQVGREKIAFLTLTLPNFSEADLAKCNENFHELLRQYCQHLKRRLAKAGVSQEYVCSVEIQEGRWTEKGQLALHAHLVFQGKKYRYSNWILSKEEVRDIWAKLLTNLMGRNIECPAATKIEWVRKSVARYLGKYLSKGGKVVNQIIEANRREELPSKWDRISDALRRKVKQEIKHFTRNAKVQIAYNLEALKEQGILNWYYEVKVDFSKYEWWDDKKHRDPIRVISICGEIAKGYEEEFKFVEDLSIFQNS